MASWGHNQAIEDDRDDGDEDDDDDGECSDGVKMGEEANGG